MLMTIEGSPHPIGDAVAADMTDCAAIFNTWVDETPSMPRVHSRQDILFAWQMEGRTQ